MQEQLARTQTSIGSLQALLEQMPADADVVLRLLPAMTTLAVRERVGFDECTSWLELAFADLHGALDRAGLAAAGPDGALYPEEFFETEVGSVVAFVPVPGTASAAADFGPRIQRLEIAAGDHAVMTHTGPFADLDQTYGALGTIVAERGIGIEGPVREHYFDDHADVCWPIARGTAPFTHTTQGADQ
jgi:effector-binding domain-containing protein